MRCPFCGYENTKVIDSRSYFEGNSIKRRRECEKCGKRFTTHEKVAELSLIVIKKSGIKQPYSREKVYNGIVRAFENRNIDIEKIEELLVSNLKNGKIVAIGVIPNLLDALEILRGDTMKAKMNIAFGDVQNANTDCC